MKLIKPAWNETLEFLVGMLDEEKSKEVAGVIAESYFTHKKMFKRSPKQYSCYNPGLDDLCLAWKCINGNNPLTVTFSWRELWSAFFNGNKNTPRKIYQEMRKWVKLFGTGLPFNEYGNFDSYLELQKKQDRPLFDYQKIVQWGICDLEIIAQAYDLKVGDTGLIRMLDSFLGHPYSEHEQVYTVLRIIHTRNKPTTY